MLYMRGSMPIIVNRRVNWRSEWGLDIHFKLLRSLFKGA